MRTTTVIAITVFYCRLDMNHWHQKLVSHGLAKSRCITQMFSDTVSQTAFHLVVTSLDQIREI